LNPFHGKKERKTNHSICRTTPNYIYLFLNQFLLMNFFCLINYDCFSHKKHTGFSTMTTSQQNILGKFIKTNTEKIVKNEKFNFTEFLYLSQKEELNKIIIIYISVIIFIK